MCPDVLLAPRFLEALVTAFAVLGGVMAAWSGALAAIELLRRWALPGLGDMVNLGIAVGFVVGAPAAILAAVTIMNS